MAISFESDMQRTVEALSLAKVLMVAVERVMQHATCNTHIKILISDYLLSIWVHWFDSGVRHSHMSFGHFQGHHSQPSLACMIELVWIYMSYFISTWITVKYQLISSCTIPMIGFCSPVRVELTNSVIRRCLLSDPRMIWIKTNYHSHSP